MTGVTAVLAVAVPVLLVALWAAVRRDGARLKRAALAAAVAPGVVGSIIGTAIMGYGLVYWLAIQDAVLLAVLGLSLGHPAYLLPADAVEGRLSEPPPHQRWLRRLKTPPTRRQQVTVFLISVAAILAMFGVVAALGG